MDDGPCGDSECGLCYKINLLVRSNIVQDALIMKRYSISPQMPVLVEPYVQGRQISIINICLSFWDCVFPLHDRRHPMQSSATKRLMVFSGNSAILDYQHFPLFFFFAILLNCNSQISFCERKTILLIYSFYLHFVYRPTSNLKSAFQRENSCQQRRACLYSKTLDICIKFSTWGFLRGYIQQLYHRQLYSYWVIGPGGKEVYTKACTNCRTFLCPIWIWQSCELSSKWFKAPNPDVLHITFKIQTSLPSTVTLSL